MSWLQQSIKERPAGQCFVSSFVCSGKQIHMLKIWGERELIIGINISLIWQSYFCVYFLQIFMVPAITLVLESRKIETPLFIWLLNLVTLHIFPQVTFRLIWCICNILCPTRSSNETFTVIAKSDLQIEHKLRSFV